jgi:hypothetical protein
MKSKLFSGPIECPNRLGDLGLNAEMLWNAVMRGQAASASCTVNHPPLYRGIRAWAETTSGFREVVLPLGWGRSDDGNLPLTINPTGTLAITVATGDEDTGKKDGNPCTKSKKGPRTSDAVKRNELQGQLFGDIRLRPDDLKKIDGRMTWILLFHCDTEAGEVRAELSLPTKMNVEDYVDGWVERIILGSMPFGSVTIADPSDLPQTPPLEVDVKRRHA